MEPREPRNKVLVKARMQCGAQWQDVCILNVSAHGLGLTCDIPPPRGTYIEVRRGPFVIVARVAWVKGHRFGVRTQDPVTHDAIAGSAAPGPQAKGARERRRTARPALRLESRDRGRAIEFVGMALAISAGAAIVADTAYAQLAVPLERVRAALSVSAP